MGILTENALPVVSGIAGILEYERLGPNRDLNSMHGCEESWSSGAIRHRANIETVVKWKPV
ncbi:MAG TPA: hypothetical protein VN673_01595, partial [Clostridia bacterium]|nr:hypothetical protein [Clostridia bacterium]